MVQIMNWIIDRFEGDFALVEIDDDSIIKLPKKALPKGAKEGDVISIKINKEETKNRKENIGKLMDSLFVD